MKRFLVVVSFAVFASLALSTDMAMSAAEESSAPVLDRGTWVPISNNFGFVVTTPPSGAFPPAASGYFMLRLEDRWVQLRPDAHAGRVIPASDGRK